MKLSRWLLALTAVVLATTTGREQLAAAAPLPDPLSRAAGSGATTPMDPGMHMPAETGSLQTMIDSTATGGTLHVSAGIYDGPIVIDRPMTVHAMGPATVEGHGAGSVIAITSAGVTVDGLAAQHSAPGPVGQPAGISIEADDVSVRNVTVRDAYIGIAVRGVNGSHIEDSTVLGDAAQAIDDPGHAMASHDMAMPDMPGMEQAPSDSGHVMGGAQATTRGDGISLWNATDAQVMDNHVIGVRDGIYVSYGAGTVVEGNTVQRSRYAMHDMYASNLTIRGNTLRDSLSGLVLMYGGPVVLDHNVLVGNRSISTGFGVLIKDADEVFATGNTIADNRVGIHLENGGARVAEAAAFSGNTVAMNEMGIELAPASRAVFSSNSFTDNTVPVLFAGGEHAATVRWSADGRGNFWSTYHGFDGNGDGIGDLPFEEPGIIGDAVGTDGDLAAVAGSPGAQMLGRLDARWHPDRAAVVDEAPLMQPPHPAVSLPARGTTSPILILALGLLAAVSAGAVLRARRPRSTSGGLA